MKILEPIYINVIEKLIGNKVEFLLIGGYAVNYYGYGRFTGDLDFWLRPDEENKKRFLKAMQELNKDSNDINAVAQLDFTKAQTITIGKQPDRVDFLTQVNLVGFNEAWEKRKFLQIKNMQMPVVDYHHLILTKFNTGRPQDKSDIEQLQKINQLKQKKKP